MDPHNTALLPLTTNAEGVAQRLGVAVNTFYNKRISMEAEGFPQKLPGTNRWSLPAIDRWITANGETIPELEADAIAAARARLEENYAGGAS